MFISGSDVYTNMVQAYDINPAIYGLAPLPLQGKNAGVLGGGTLAAVKPTATANQIAAALKWINFYYMQPLSTRKGAVRNAEALLAQKQPIGVPEFPVLDKQAFLLSQKWIKQFINVPVKQMASFTNGILTAPLIPEPESATQAVYGDLDSVVQSVLTDPNANIPALLQAANPLGQASIAAGNATS
jgi:hypothetical protein